MRVAKGIVSLGGRPVWYYGGGVWCVGRMREWVVRVFCCQCGLGGCSEGPGFWVRSGTVFLKFIYFQIREHLGQRGGLGGEYQGGCDDRNFIGSGW